MIIKEVKSAQVYLPGGIANDAELQFEVYTDRFCEENMDSEYVFVPMAEMVAFLNGRAK